VFYVMPFVEGESLRDRLNREKQLSVDDAVRLVREAAAALDYAHRHGVIHRDIKPENILIHDGQALVADFGIALAVSRSDGGTRMTETGLSLGTPHYMSPEQAMGERTIDARTDIYALGCVLYELLTGEPPFTGPTAQAIVAKVLSTEPEPVTTLRRTVPAHVVDAVHTAIQKLPADRFKSAAEFSAGLGGQAVGRTVGPGAHPGRTLPAGPPARLPALAAWLVAAIAVVAAAVGWLRKVPPPPVTRFAITLPDSLSVENLPATRLAVSPDGRRLVHVEGRDRSQLWMRSLDQLESRPVPGTVGAINPVFSPDGQQLAYVAGSPLAIMVTGLDGGSPTRVTDSMVDPGGLSWGPDGLYFDGHLAGDGIAVIRSPGGTPEIVTTPDTANGELWHFQPEALPNGKGLLFVVSFGSSVERMQVAVFDFKTRKHKLLGLGLSPRWTSSGHLLFVTAQGTLMAVPFDPDRLEAVGEPRPVASGLSVRTLGHVDLAVSPAGTLAYGFDDTGGSMEELVWVSRDGSETLVDTTWRARFAGLELSPDGTRLATSLFDAAGRQVWVKELDRGPVARFSFDGEMNDYPAWSPDGKRIVFTHTEEKGRVFVFEGPADGGTMPRPMMQGPARLRSARYSRDGEWLILLVATDLFARRSRGDTTLVPLAATNAQERQGQVSPDGRWLLYESDESGRREIYVRSFPNIAASKRQVSTGRGGAFAARWSADGREIFYESLARQFVAVPVLPGATFAIGESRVLFSTNVYTRAPWLLFDVHPDGKRFIMARRLEASAGGDRLVVVQNFFEELKGK
jgi:serine/threonine-protein kinase